MTRFLAALLLGLLAACAQTPEQAAEPVAKPPAPMPAVSESSLRDRAREQLAQGIKLYEASDYDNAIRALNASLDHGLLSRVEQSRARKYLAFIHCTSNREAQCRAEFLKAFEINADFALSPAEDGHPVWGAVYRSVRTQLIAEREAAQNKPFSLLPRGKAEQLLENGLLKYDAGDYPEALKILEIAVKEGLKDRTDQVRALKHIAFCLCLAEKWRDCRAAFVRIYDVDPDFDLMPAEAGHPHWKLTFAQAKAQAKRALAEKAAKEKKAPTAPAAVPRKN
jgi:hypothetical protein